MIKVEIEIYEDKIRSDFLQSYSKVVWHMLAQLAFDNLTIVPG